MIQIRQFTPAQLKFYSPNDQFIGLVNNSIEALQVRVDIAKEKLEGYYFMSGNIKIDILSNGEVRNWPEGLYGEMLTLCVKLRNIQQA